MDSVPHSPFIEIENLMHEEQLCRLTDKYNSQTNSVNFVGWDKTKKEAYDA